MRREVLYGVTGSLALLWLWHVWPDAGKGGRGSTGVLRRAAAASPSERPARRRADPAPTLESLLHTHLGLCGTEVPPARGAAPQLPDELRALTQGRVTPEQLATIEGDFGLELPSSPGQLAQAALLHRVEIERQAAEPLGQEHASEAWVDRVDQLQELGRRQEALEVARRAFARWPEMNTALRLADVLEETGQPGEAKRVLQAERARTSDAKDRAWSDAQLGFVCATRGDPACAARAVQSLDESGANPHLATFTRAVQQTFLGRFDEARAAYEQSLALERDPVAMSNLGEVEICAGRIAEGRAMYLEALARTPRLEVTTSALSGLAYASLREGEIVPAWLFGAAALAGAGDGAEASQPRGVLALAALVGGDLAEARRQARLAHEADPNDDLVRRRCFADAVDTAATRALAAEAKGDRDSAVEAWLTVARSGHQTLSVAARRALGEICR